MEEILTAKFGSVGEVRLALERVEAHCLARRDRRGVFATAYLQITRALEAEIAREGFRDPAWTGRYLVEFGNLYRQALLACERGETAAIPKAWRIAFDAAREGRGLVIQHLVLGINAHINHDLALALGRVGIDPERSGRYEDHTRVNAVLEASTAALKSQVSRRHAPLLQRLDWVAGRLDDDLTRFSIPRARDHAWSFAVAIAGAHGASERELLLRALDEQAAVLARLVLSPPTHHPMLLRVVRSAERADAALRRVTRLFAR